MLLADTSVWVDLLRGLDTPARHRLAAALRGGEPVCVCGLILTEVLQGVASPVRRRSLEAAFRPLLYLPTLRRTYVLAADLYRRARRRGKAVRSTIDCVVAACALEHGIAILHRDRDYDVLASVSDLEVVSP